MSVDVLTPRALGRATLARHFLLERSHRPVLDVVAHLVGMQAQIPHNPYLAMWSRLDGFQPDELSQLLIDRKVVRIVVMRATLHLVTADDCLLLRPLVQPVLDGELRRHPEFGPALVGVDLEPVLDFARGLLAEGPRTGTQLRAAMHERFPDLHAGALAYACRNFLAFVQVPPRGVWGRSAQVSSTTAETWLGRPLSAAPSIDDVVLRYLGAFGPATAADAATWSRLTGLGEVLERLRPRLRSFRDERGRELFDLPDVPRPDPDTLAPARFLPEYDNVLLSHADRTRVISEENRRRLSTSSGPVNGVVLYDGVGIGTWWKERAGDRVTLSVRHVDSLAPGATDDIEREAYDVLRLLEPDAGAHDVRLVPV